MKDMVSIVVPCYNATKYIPNLIDDVSKQTYKDWELIIVSNGIGQEEQYDLAIKLTQNITKAKVIKTHTGGVSFARNIGIQHAEGQWICFIDVDDRLQPDHLELLLSATDVNCDVVEGGFYQVDINGKESKIIYPHATHNLELNEKGMYKCSCLGALEKVGNAPWNKLFRKSFIIENNIRYDTRFTMNEDRIFMMQAFGAAKSWIFIPITGYVYKANYGSAMSRYHANIEESWKLYLDLKDEIKCRNGISRDLLNEERTRLQYYLVWQNCWNIFKPGCPFSYVNKVKYIRHMICEEKFTLSCKLHDWKNERMRFKIFHYCSMTGSGNIVAILFIIQHYGKQIVNFVNDLKHKIIKK